MYLAHTPIIMDLINIRLLSETSTTFVCQQNEDKEERDVWNRISSIQFDSIKCHKKRYTNIRCCSTARKELKNILKDAEFVSLSEAGNIKISYNYYDSPTGNNCLLSAYYILKFLLYDKGATWYTKYFKNAEISGCQSYEEMKRTGISKKLLIALDEELQNLPISQALTKEEITELMPGYTAYY